MQKYILRRLMLAVPTLLGVTVLVFVGVRVIPGDPLAGIVGDVEVYVRTEQELANVRSSLGLDRPLVVQYLTWVRDLLKFDLGYSFWQSDVSVREIIIRRAPITLEISVLSLVLSWIIGLPVGMIAALWRNSLLDYAARLGVTLFMSVPSFWLALMIILITVVYFSWRPPIELAQLWENPAQNLQMVVGPVLAMTAGFAAVVARMVRSSLLETLGEDYIRTARAKGLAERVVVTRHALRNSILPAISLSAVYLGGTLGGAVAVETALSVPGLGFTLVFAVTQRDWLMIQNLIVLFAIIFVLINLAIDILYALIDPRIRYG